jgi:hypothetical protein
MPEFTLTDKEVQRIAGEVAKRLYAAPCNGQAVEYNAKWVNERGDTYRAQLWAFSPELALAIAREATLVPYVSWRLYEIIRVEDGAIIFQHYEFNTR